MHVILQGQYRPSLRHPMHCIRIFKSFLKNTGRHVNRTA